MAGLGVLLLGIPSSAAAAGRYPDLRTLPIQRISLDTVRVGEQSHYVVRFTNTVMNAGEGPLELHGTPHFPVDGKFDADQWVYGDTGIDIHRVGTFAYHSGHRHFHFDNFARYELWTKRDFDRAETRNFSVGGPRWASPKVTFCVFDLKRIDSPLPRGPYQTCTPVLEGLSPGFADVYDAGLADQWVDVGGSPLSDGQYVLRSIADADNVLFESEGKADPAREGQLANSVTAPITIVDGQLAG